MMEYNDLLELLNSESERINSPQFIDADPIQFPRRFETLQDIEIVAFLSASIAWGNRKMICHNCEKMLQLMDFQPYNYVMDCGYDDIHDRFNIHRTFFSDDFSFFLRGLNRIYNKYGSINTFAKSNHISEQEFPAWELIRLMNEEFDAANIEYPTSKRCLPRDLSKTALKRINMALRWLVRNDGIVDMGVWDCLKPKDLYIPLDVHVGDTARELGLLTRKANDKTSVALLTAELRKMRPDDPVFYDFALFGIGIGAKYTDNE